MAYDRDEGPISPTYPKDEGDVHTSGGATERGRGSARLPADNGTLWKGREVREQVGGFTFLEGMARGDREPKGSDETREGMSPGAPVWTDGMSIDCDAINASGGGLVADCKSDPMFDKFKHEETSWDITANRTNGGRNTPDSVSHSSLPSDDSGTHSDPAYEHMPAEQQKGGGGNPNALDIA